MTQLNFSIAASLAPPALDWMFRVRLPQDFSSKKSDNILQRITNFIRPEEVMAETVGFSFRHATALQRFYYGKQLNFAGFTEVGQCTMNLYETWDYRTTQYLKKWKSHIFDEKTLAYFPSDEYKKNIVIQIYEDTQSDKPVVEVTLIGAWPGEVSGYDYAYSNDGRIVLSTPFNIDDVEIDISEQNGEREIPNAILSSIGLR